MKGFMGGLYRISEWIMRLAVINVLWVICSFPVFFLVFLILLTPQENIVDVFFGIMTLIGILMPFIWFPATTAMFALARKWVMGDEDVPMFKTYFLAYKDNYVQSMVGGIIFVITIAIIVVNYHFYVTQDGLMRGLTIFFLVFGVFMLAAMINFFSMLAHIHMKVVQLFKNSLLISIGKPVNTMFLIIGNFTIIYISLFKFTFLIPFFMGTISATYSFWLFYRSFLSIQAKQVALEETRKQDEADAFEQQQVHAGQVPDLQEDK